MGNNRAVTVGTDAVANALRRHDRLLRYQHGEVLHASRDCRYVRRATTAEMVVRSPAAAPLRPSLCSECVETVGDADAEAAARSGGVVADE